jgi:hypothetical protein
MLDYVHEVSTDHPSCYPCRQTSHVERKKQIKPQTTIDFHALTPLRSEYSRNLVVHVFPHWGHVFPRCSLTEIPVCAQTRKNGLVMVPQCPCDACLQTGCLEYSGAGCRSYGPFLDIGTCLIHWGPWDVHLWGGLWAGAVPLYFLLLLPA